MISLEIVTAPTGEIIPLADVKLHLRVGHNLDDTLIQSYVAAAAFQVGVVLAWRTLPLTTWRATFDWWDGVQVYLPNPPVKVLSSVEIYDDSQNPPAVVTLDLANVALDKELGRVRFYGDAVNGGGAPGRLRIEYVAGYDTLPDWARQAILLLTGHYYENRESVVVGAGVVGVAIPQAVDDLALAHKAWRPGGAV